MELKLANFQGLKLRPRNPGIIFEALSRQMVADNSTMKKTMTDINNLTILLSDTIRNLNH